MARRRGELKPPRGYYEASLAQQGDSSSLCLIPLCNLGYVLRGLGDLDGAAAAITRANAASRRHHMLKDAAHLFAVAGGLAVSRGRVRRGTLLLGAGQGLYDTLGYVMDQVDSGRVRGRRRRCTRLPGR